MRQNAQKRIELQDCLPADRDSMGLGISQNLGIAVAVAYEKWVMRRGIQEPVSFFSSKLKARAVKNKIPKKKNHKKASH